MALINYFDDQCQYYTLRKNVVELNTYAHQIPGLSVPCQSQVLYQHTGSVVGEWFTPPQIWRDISSLAPLI